jgi:hypothetical protein
MRFGYSLFILKAHYYWPSNWKGVSGGRGNKK